MKLKKVLPFFFLLLVPATSARAYWVWSPESGKFVNPEGAVQDTAEEQYDYAMQFYKEKDLDQATEQLQNLLKKFPGARIAPEAQYRLGNIYEEKGDFWKAFHAYKVLLESYPQSERLNEAVEREFRIGNLFLSGKKAKFMGLEVLPSLPRAAEIFQHIVKNAPYSEFGNKAQFRVGLTYKKWGHYDEALQAFQALLDQYPKSDLVPDARFQLAETAFAKSAAAHRDQRALDDAMGQIDHFLARHADTGATSEKAAKLRQEIDEKNAEKNYRIGLFYEKESYLTSALIYYEDVAKRYPHTRWGEKAEVKLKSLREPVSYLSAQDKQIKAELAKVEAEFEAVPDSDTLERGRMKRQLERLKRREKSMEENKGESLKRRRDDLNRRGRELKDKFKKLGKKKKLLRKNPSEDFKRAMDRWTASLQAEQDSLASERRQLKDWSRELGLPQRNFGVEFLPFLGEPPSELEKVRRVEAKKLFKVSGEKKSLLEEKEVLYKQYGEVVALLDETEARRLGLAGEEKEFSGALERAGENLRARHEKLKSVREEIERLETERAQKSSLYEKNFGVPGWLGWLKAPTHTVARTTAGAVTKSLGTLSVLNPFEGKNLEDLDPQELLEQRMHLKEKIAAQQSLTDTLTQAFDAELALQEQKRLLATLESGEPTDPRELRRATKRLEKDIRSRYEEIEDRHDHKKKLLEELDALLKEKGVPPGLPRVARTVSAPAVGFLRLSKAFFVGLPHEDVELTESAEALRSDTAASERARKLKEKVELESLLIEAKNREILNLQKELEILRAKASLAGGFKFRSAFVKVPYLFIGEAIESAQRLVPRKNRQEVLIQRLDQETRELEALKADLRTVEAAIEKKPPVEERTEAETPTPPAPAPEPSAPGEAAMRSELEAMAAQLANKAKAYEHEKAILERELEAFSSEADQTTEGRGWKKSQRHLGQREEKLRKELKEIEGELAKLIVKESELEQEESVILEKRIHKIDTVIQKVHSKALSQDLLTERERMEERLSQLESRRGFLVKELERFQLPETGHANP